MSALGQLSYLVRSENRPALLRTIKNHPGRPCDIVERCRISRATVQRIISDFEERGWIAKRDSRYHLTAAGSIILEQYETVANTVNRVTEAAPVLRHFDADAAPPLASLADSTLVTATEQDPHAPLSHYIDTLDQSTATSVRLMTPVTSPILDDVHSRLLEASTSITVMTTEPVINDRSTDHWITDVPAKSLFVHPGPLRTGYALLEDRVLVTTYDDQGHIQGCLDGSAPQIRTWATEQFESARGSARRLSVIRN